MTLSASILLYLIPGLLASTGYFFSAPILTAMGADPFTAFIVGVSPGFFYMWHRVRTFGRKNGAFSLKELTAYSEQIKLGRLISLSIITVVVMFALYMVGYAIFKELIIEIQKQLPEWHFESLSFQAKLISGVFIEGLSTLHLVVVLIGLNLFIGLIGPIIEELYFTGIIFSRTEQTFGRIHVAMHTFMFSAYHLFSIWLVPIRVLSIWPMYFLVKRYRSIWMSLLTHSLLNILGSIGVSLAVLKELLSRL